MFIVAVLLLAVVSIGLFLVAIALKSRSVAMLNFIVCLIAAFVIMPWFTYTLQPPPSDPASEGMRLNWIAGMIWIFIFSTSVIAGSYTLIAVRGLKEEQRRKRRRRSGQSSRSRGSVEQTRESDVTPDGS